jgi:hypothetical protein
MSERFIHYSDKPLKAVHSVRQHEKPDRKPQGLWFSVDDGEIEEPCGWREWCTAEGFNLPGLAAQTEVILRHDTRALRLSNARDLDAFHKAHATGDWEIDWKRIADEYQAIIIAPYVWSRRLSRLSWYYTWDCASGCVWDAAAVAELRAIEAKASVANGTTGM